MLGENIWLCNMYLFMIILRQEPDPMEHACQCSRGIGPATVERNREYDKTSLTARHPRESEHHHRVSREMVVHEKFISAHDMRIKIPCQGEVCHLRKPFLNAPSDAWIDVSTNSWLIVYYLLCVVGFLWELTHQFAVVDLYSRLNE